MEIGNVFSKDKSGNWQKYDGTLGISPDEYLLLNLIDKYRDGHKHMRNAVIERCAQVCDNKAQWIVKAKCRNIVTKLGTKIRGLKE